MYEQLHRELLAKEVLHADETTLQVLHEPGKEPQSKSYMWLYRTSGDTDNPVVMYEYQSGRGAVHPREFLEGFKGYLHADGYAGYTIQGVVFMNQAMLNTELYQTMYAEQERYKAELLCMPRKKLRMSAGPPQVLACSFSPYTCHGY